mgnify:CR=1 FL=1
MCPIYNYQCPKCGLCFDKHQSIVMRDFASCPDCGASGSLVPSLCARPVVRNKERLQYGSGSAGRYVSSKETGGLPVYIPSFGAMEQAEVDDVAEAAIEREKERVKVSAPRQSAVALQNIVKETMKAPKGQRKKTMELIKKGGMA